MTKAKMTPVAPPRTTPSTTPMTTLTDPARTLPRQTKAALLRARLSEPGGASLAALIAATGWQAHTLRAALSGLRKTGLPLTRRREGDDTFYAIETDGSAAAAVAASAGHRGPAPGSAPGSTPGSAPGSAPGMTSSSAPGMTSSSASGMTSGAAAEKPGARPVAQIAAGASLPGEARP